MVCFPIRLIFTEWKGIRCTSFFMHFFFGVNLMMQVWWKQRRPLVNPENLSGSLITVPLPGSSPSSGSESAPRTIWAELAWSGYWQRSPWWAAPPRRPWSQATLSPSTGCMCRACPPQPPTPAVSVADPSLEAREAGSESLVPGARLANMNYKKEVMDSNEIVCSVVDYSLKPQPFKLNTLFGLWSLYSALTRNGTMPIFGFRSIDSGLK